MLSWILTFLLGFLPGCPETPLEREQRCMPLVQKILDIQAERDELMDDLDLNRSSMEAGTITSSEQDDLFRLWKEKEDRLRREVTLLYDDAYAGGCL